MGPDRAGFPTLAFSRPYVAVLVTAAEFQVGRERIIETDDLPSQFSSAAIDVPPAHIRRRDSPHGGPCAVSTFRSIAIALRIQQHRTESNASHALDLREISRT